VVIIDDNNSIINPELYDKYVAGKEKIKKYENFKIIDKYEDED
jgi:hypothetical protein